MPPDFTFAAFDEFCQRLSHMPVFTVAAYLARSVQPPTPFIILRLDVDYRDRNAVHMARIAERYHLRASFYFRRHAAGFDLDAIQAVAELDHEVGYHFETLDTCQGNFEQAEDLLLDHLEELRAAGLPILTAASHGAIPTAPTYHHNFDLFERVPDLFERADLLGETTLSIDFGKVTYLSDASWHWRRYPHFRPDIKGQPTSLHIISNDLVRRDAGLYINFHPHQWFAHPASTLYYRTRSRIGRHVLPWIKRYRLKNPV
ncbi:MAG: hypothetical protein HY866_18030 [Chloroflexi bacterium]|nr:hypothetical protein [Chloroflexota bacterium]